MHKEISFEEFSVVAEKISAQGQVPTPEMLLKIIGRGTQEEMTQHLRTWQDLKNPNHSILDGSSNASAVSIAVQEVILHANGEVPQVKAAPKTPLDTGIDPENNSETHAAMSELMRENKVLTEKIMALMRELESFKKKAEK
jgi:hypothetical protein